MVQVLSHQPLNVETQIQSQTSSCGLCGRQSDAGKSFSQRTMVFPSVTFHQCSTLIYSSNSDATYS